MPEQEKPGLEEGFYFVRHHALDRWEPARVIKEGGELFVYLTGDTDWWNGQSFEIGPRLHPPQEGEG